MSSSIQLPTWLEFVHLCLVPTCQLFTTVTTNPSSTERRRASTWFLIVHVVHVVSQLLVLTTAQAFYIIRLAYSSCYLLLPLLVSSKGDEWIFVRPPQSTINRNCFCVFSTLEEGQDTRYYCETLGRIVKNIINKLDFKLHIFCIINITITKMWGWKYLSIMY